MHRNGEKASLHFSTIGRQAAARLSDESRFGRAFGTGTGTDQAEQSANVVEHDRRPPERPRERCQFVGLGQTSSQVLTVPAQSAQALDKDACDDAMQAVQVGRVVVRKVASIQPVPQMAVRVDDGPFWIQRRLCRGASH